MGFPIYIRADERQDNACQQDPKQPFFWLGDLDSFLTMPLMI